MLKPHYHPVYKDPTVNYPLVSLREIGEKPWLKEGDVISFMVKTSWSDSEVVWLRVTEVGRASISGYEVNQSGEEMKQDTRRLNISAVQNEDATWARGTKPVHLRYFASEWKEKVKEYKAAAKVKGTLMEITRDAQDLANVVETYRKTQRNISNRAYNNALDTILSKYEKEMLREIEFQTVLLQDELDASYTKAEQYFVARLGDNHWQASLLPFQSLAECERYIELREIVEHDSDKFGIYGPYKVP